MLHCALQLLEKLVYSGSQNTFDNAVTTIENDFPEYHRYLTDNWLPHVSLFAGYARTGKTHHNIHTNNHLER